MPLDAVAARNLAEGLLAEALPRRFAHTAAVARRGAVIDAARDEGALLEVTGWVHDVGYAPALAVTGFHHLDGARFLRDRGVDERVVGLVAFHSSAAAEAAEYGVAEGLAAFDDERTPARDLFWYLDMTTGPDGRVVTFEERMDEVRERYPADHHVVRALEAGMAERVGAVDRARAWLATAGLDGDPRPEGSP